MHYYFKALKFIQRAIAFSQRAIAFTNSVHAINLNTNSYEFVFKLMA
jgi:hypothetical protein